MYVSWFPPPPTCPLTAFKANWDSFFTVASAASNSRCSSSRISRYYRKMMNGFSRILRTLLICNFFWDKNRRENLCGSGSSPNPNALFIIVDKVSQVAIIACTDGVTSNISIWSELATKFPVLKTWIDLGLAVGLWNTISYKTNGIRLSWVLSDERCFFLRKHFHKLVIYYSAIMNKREEKLQKERRNTNRIDQLIISSKPGLVQPANVDAMNLASLA